MTLRSLSGTRGPAPARAPYAGGTAGRTFGGDLLHLSDLAPSSSEDEMEESVVMEFDLHSDGSGDGALW